MGSEHDVLLQVLKGAIVTAVEHVGAPVVRVVVRAVLDMVGVDTVRLEIDEWKLAAAASDAAFAAKFKEEP